MSRARCTGALHPRATLAAHEVPEIIVAFASLPVNSNGKVDRAAIAAAARDARRRRGCAAATAGAGAAPGDDAEEAAMCALWAEAGTRAAVVGAVGEAYWNATMRELRLFEAQAELQVVRLRTALAKLHPIPPVPGPGPGPSPTPTPPSRCTVALTKRTSRRSCTYEGAGGGRGAEGRGGGTYGCTAGTATMWVDGGCAGVFTCDGVPRISCKSMGEKRQVCSCA